MDLFELSCSRLMSRKPSKPAISLRPRLRVLCDDETTLGPGRVDLLEFIAQTGSLRSAAEQMGMSYMRAWKIVQSLNTWFRPALVEVVRGGRSGGGAKLTESGREIVTLYRRMEKESQKAMEDNWRELRKFLKTKHG